MTDITDYLDARAKLGADLAEARERLWASVCEVHVSVARSASARALVRFARTCWVPSVREALRAFETDVRPALVAYHAAARRANRPLDPSAEFLIEHFDQFTEVPINASPVKRVVSWARRNYRAWRKADG